MWRARGAGLGQNEPEDRGRAGTSFLETFRRICKVTCAVGDLMLSCATQRSTEEPVKHRQCRCFGVTCLNLLHFFFKWVKMLFFDERERFRQDEERYRCFSDICSGLSLMRHYSFTLRRAELTNAQKGEVRFSVERQGPPEGQRRFAVLCSLWHRPAPRARSSPFTCMRCPAGRSTEKKSPQSEVLRSGQSVV